MKCNNNVILVHNKWSIIILMSEKSKKKKPQVYPILALKYSFISHQISIYIKHSQTYKTLYQKKR